MKNALKYKKQQKIIYYQDETLAFGKYKGKTIEWVLDYDPEYLIWLDDHNIVEFLDTDDILYRAMLNCESDEYDGSIAPIDDIDGDFNPY